MDKQELLDVLTGRYDRFSTYCDNCGGCATKERITHYSLAEPSYDYTVVVCARCGLEDSGGPLIEEVICKLEGKEGLPIRAGHLIMLAEIMKEYGYSR